ncbi:O-antigen ligase family protein, partial [Prochlorothrix hollandica]
MRITKSQILTVEYVTAIIGLLFYTGALGKLLVTSFHFPRPTITLIRYGILLPGLVTFFLQPKAVLNAILQGKLAWIVMAMATLSFAWSVNSGSSFGSIRTELLPMSIFSLYLSIRFPLKLQFSILLIILQFVSFVSIFYAIAVPSIGQHSAMTPWPGSWKGLFVHKNAFGSFMTLTAGMIFIKIWFTQHKQPIIFVPLLLLIIAALFSGSKGALILSQVFCILIFSYTLIRWRGKRGLIFIYILVVTSILVIGILTAIWNPLMLAIGKDPTMSARTEIWKYIRLQLSSSPILGFGRGAFWITPRFLSGIWQATGDVPANAHNGFYELALDIGYLGLLVFFASFFVNVGKALKLAYKAKKPEYMWPLAFLTFIIMQNMLESFLMRQESFNWVMYLVVSSSLDKWNHDRQWLENKEKTNQQSPTTEPLHRVLNPQFKPLYQLKAEAGVNQTETSL